MIRSFQKWYHYMKLYRPWYKTIILYNGLYNRPNWDQRFISTVWVASKRMWRVREFLDAIIFGGLRKREDRQKSSKTRLRQPGVFRKPFFRPRDPMILPTAFSKTVLWFQDRKPWSRYIFRKAFFRERDPIILPSACSKTVLRWCD